MFPIIQQTVERLRGSATVPAAQGVYHVEDNGCLDIRHELLDILQDDGALGVGISD
jgi:hypothetical protein